MRGMKFHHGWRLWYFVGAVALATAPRTASAQGTVADYERAMTLRDAYHGLAIHVPEQVTWIEKTNRFWYRRGVKGGNDFVLVDAQTGKRDAPFDHARLAASLSTATHGAYTAVTLPLTRFTFVDEGRAIEFMLNPAAASGAATPPGAPDGPNWRCTLDTYTCKEATARRERDGRRGGPLAGPVRPPFEVNSVEPKKSPDGRYEAFVNNYNLAIRETGTHDVTLLGTDGSEGGYYDPDTIAWSPDSTKIAVYKITPGYRRYVHYVESSPENQLQPKHSTLQYAKPGDVLDVERPVIFHVNTKQQFAVDNALFPNPYDMTQLEWRKNSAGVTFEYNERGHHAYRVIEVDAATGRARAVITESAKTFFSTRGRRSGPSRRCRW